MGNRDEKRHAAFLERMAEEGRKRDEHMWALAEEEGVEKNPKLMLLYEKAWEAGHAYGYEEVANKFRDLVDLIR